MLGMTQAEMPFLDHLEELRWRLFRCAIAIALGVGGAFALLYTKQIDVIALLSRPIQPYLHSPLMVTHPSDLFDIVMNTSIALGLIAASPVLIWQVWGFLSPALYGHEKKIVIPMLVGAAILFLAGMALAYVYVLPVTFGFLMSFQSAAVEVKPTVHEYFGFVMAMCLAFGAVFEMPIVILLLTTIGLVKPQFLSKFRRHAFVGCIIGAAIITPGSDPTSLFLLTIPLYFLYELSIGLSRLVYSRRERRLAAQDTLGA
ncbi:MAG: twin-arginine translocase subunit TatC [Gemmatimonadaceae bacterium]|nr:twin-arginine translocase subunit TatC [Gemmatimonadaceae bacterium]